MLLIISHFSMSSRKETMHYGVAVTITKYMAINYLAKCVCFHLNVLSIKILSSHNTLEEPS